MRPRNDFFPMVIKALTDPPHPPVAMMAAQILLLYFIFVESAQSCGAPSERAITFHG
jgi:hypothetical protein